jgi:Bacterial lectin
LALNGGATINGTALQLTDGGPYESRSVFFSTPVGLASFTTAFDFRLRGNETLTPAPDADGFTLVLQANGPDALGSAGGGLGYGLPAIGQPGPNINNSIAVTFDLHNNNGEGASSTGLYVERHQRYRRSTCCRLQLISSAAMFSTWCWFMTGRF